MVSIIIYQINDLYFEKELNNKDVEEIKIKYCLYNLSSDTTLKETFSNHDK